MNNFDSFFEYYSKNLKLDENELEEFKSILQKKLPVTLRLKNKQIRDLIAQNEKQNYKKYDIFPEHTVIQYTAEAFQQSEFKELIVQSHCVSWLYRQELVSMLPVLYSSISPNHNVLEMCAAPGSKTTQVLSILEKGTGILVSNDSDIRRVKIIARNSKGYLCPGYLITCTDARVFPNIQISPNEDLRFDRIICDVPCTGDGTMRKTMGRNLNRWRKKAAISLSQLQFDILRRGLELLSDDGILTYSTCSFNPLENEAVVQRAVLELNCEIVEPPKFNEIITRSGLADWDPMLSVNDLPSISKKDNKSKKKNKFSDKNNDIDNVDKAVDDTRCVEENKKITPDTSPENITIKEREKFERFKFLFPSHQDIGLEKCIRILPHDQDTGGFFVALLRKKCSAENKVDIKLDDANRGISINYKTEHTENRDGFAIELQDVATKEKIGFSFGVQKNVDGTYHVKSDMHTDNTEKKFEGDVKIPLISNQNIKEIEKNQEELSKNLELISNTDDEKNLDYSDKINKQASNLSTEVPKNQKFLMKGFLTSDIYLVDDIIKEKIEKQYDIKIKDYLITNTQNNTKLNIISEKIYNILKNTRKDIKLVYAGYNAFFLNFAKNNQDFINYRCRSNLLKLNDYNLKIYEFSEKDTRLVLDDYNIATDKLECKMENGPIVVKLHLLDGLFCGYAGKLITTLYINKDKRKACKIFFRRVY
ncbi:hypothetical protein EDEG_01640 [Edhazardia aedis USNM 41457]|uniref:SAM-dependent MTase RsmB/NOP-type domain-containing protein n=1 Tax=Edhazardia aedis (strain USNM 41457) TaxID=1003232 RepID=J9D9B3_EDHAE|nr:hypothetical protein EDEG_01640 [Edhazardia aedis USNM 41457]|eukprot:EJW04064.1 hypothetical protein EDEG_01640 [Edhazardia aedis USNM 41457]